MHSPTRLTLGTLSSIQPLLRSGNINLWSEFLQLSRLFVSTSSHLLMLVLPSTHQMHPYQIHQLGCSWRWRWGRRPITKIIHDLQLFQNSCLRLLSGTSLEVQWLRFGLPTQGDFPILFPLVCLPIPGMGTKIPHASQPKSKKHKVETIL